MKLKIYQIVVGNNFGKPINFYKLAEKTKYKFHWFEENNHLMGFWLENPKAHFTMFNNGKFIINGVKSLKHAKEAVRIIEKEITRAKAWK